jgi:hypothetical protein
MNGWDFPTIFKGNAVSILKGAEDVIKDLKLFFNSERYEFTQDPRYGSNVPEIRFRPKSRLTLDLLGVAISQAEVFFPNVFIRKDTIQVKYLRPGEIQVTIDVLIDLQKYPIKLELEI